MRSNVELKTVFSEILEDYKRSDDFYMLALLMDCAEQVLSEAGIKDDEEFAKGNEIFEKFIAKVLTLAQEISLSDAEGSFQSRGISIEETSRLNNMFIESAMRGKGLFNMGIELSILDGRITMFGAKQPEY